MAARQRKLHLPTRVPLAYYQVVVMLTFYVSLQSTGEERGVPNWALSAWLDDRRPSQSASEERGASTVSPTGRLVCLLLSEADLIVRVGDEGVRAQGSLGQPYFLTLVF